MSDTNHTRNPTWIETTNGGPPTNVSTPYDEVVNRYRELRAMDGWLMELEVHSGNGISYRRAFVVDHIVQIGDTVRKEQP